MNWLNIFYFVSILLATVTIIKEYDNPSIKKVK